MGVNHFTDEQMEALRLNPYVKKVSISTITYTDEFRECFAEEYATGKTPSVILREYGFDPKVLGKRRKDSLVKRIKDYSLRASGFNDTRSENCGRPATKDLTDKERIKRLENQLKSLKQENEYLKKIEFLDRQADWKQKRKQRQQKKNYKIKSILN